MNKKGILEIGTIIVVLNILLAILGVTWIELFSNQFKLSQNLVITTQGISLQCSAIVREATTNNYAQRSHETTSLASVKLEEFYGKPEKNSNTGEELELGEIELVICGDTLVEITQCEIDRINNEQVTIMACEAPAYHPLFYDSYSKILVKKQVT
jgi:hypothetical protein